jgi:hypothetical protein
MISGILTAKSQSRGHYSATCKRQEALFSASVIWFRGTTPIRSRNRLPIIDDHPWRPTANRRRAMFSEFEILLAPDALSMPGLLKVKILEGASVFKCCPLLNG